jgi:hypothetical protein
MENKLTGKIKLINETQTWDSGFSKREFVLTTQEQYPQDVKLELVKDKCSLIDKFKVGTNIDVSFNVRGNEYNGKYYVSLQAWKINEASAAATASAAPAPEAQNNMDEEDDLPF